jgi:Uma2 family endonuclease
MSTDIQMSAVTSPADDPFHIGWRDVHETMPGGERVRRQVPLTLEDFLHPKEGDHFVESSLHDEIRRYLAGVFDSRIADIAKSKVISDVGVYWDDPHYGHHCPDIAVIFDVKFRNFSSFNVAEQGTRPRLIVELTSPSTRSVDLVDKFEDYHAVGVQYYVTIDRVNPDDPWQLTGYVRTPRQYRPMILKDERGRLWLEPLNLWLAVDGDRVLCYDDLSDEPLGDYRQVVQALDLSSQQAETERLRAETERQRAEAEQARAQAEQTRADAERTRADAAEAKARELEAELARLRQNP